MKNFTSKIALTFTLLGLSSLVSEANANDYRRINREARTIERKANLLLREAEHYEAMPQHCHLVRDLESFVRLSQHITDLVKVSGDLRHIKADVNELDRTFHHIEGLFDRIEARIARGHGIKFGNTAHVKRLLNHIENCIHVMQEDVAVLEVRSHRHLDRPTYDRHDHRQAGRNVYDRGYYDRGGIYDRGGYYDRSSTYYRGGTYNRTITNRSVYDRGGYCPSYGSRGGSGLGLSIGGGSSRIQIRF